MPLTENIVPISADKYTKIYYAYFNYLKIQPPKIS